LLKFGSCWCGIYTPPKFENFSCQYDPLPSPHFALLLPPPYKNHHHFFATISKHHFFEKINPPKNLNVVKNSPSSLFSCHRESLKIDIKKFSKTKISQKNLAKKINKKQILSQWCLFSLCNYYYYYCYLY